MTKGGVIIQFGVLAMPMTTLLEEPAPSSPSPPAPRALLALLVVAAAGVAMTGLPGGTRRHIAKINTQGEEEIEEEEKKTTKVMEFDRHNGTRIHTHTCTHTGQHNTVL